MKISSGFIQVVSPLAYYFQWLSWQILDGQILVWRSPSEEVWTSTDCHIHTARKKKSIQLKVHMQSTSGVMVSILPGQHLHTSFSLKRPHGTGTHTLTCLYWAFHASMPFSERQLELEEMENSSKMKWKAQRSLKEAVIVSQAEIQGFATIMPCTKKFWKSMKIRSAPCSIVGDRGIESKIKKMQGPPLQNKWKYSSRTLNQQEAVGFTVL